jgi:hypothetical protein
MQRLRGWVFWALLVGGSAACGAIDDSAKGIPDQGSDGGPETQDDGGIRGRDGAFLDAPRDAASIPNTCEGGPPLPPDTHQPTPVSCGFADGRAFPQPAKCCTGDGPGDCFMLTYQYSCCGDTLTVGANRAAWLAFQDSGDAERWTCNACACPSGGMHTEDGKTAAFPTVSCDNGFCVTHGQ